MNTIQKAQTGGLILGGALVLGILYKLGTTFGLIKTKEDKEREAAAAALAKGASGNAAIVNAGNPSLSFNPKYWIAIIKKWQKEKNGGKNINVSQLNKLLNPLSNGQSYNVNLGKAADLIYASKSIWLLPDTETKTFGVLRNMRNQAQVSKCAELFLDAFNLDMLAYINSFTNDEQKAFIYEIIKNKPLL